MLTISQLVMKVCGDSLRFIAVSRQNYLTNVAFYI
jgi:hypothetical protein